jgi:uncharacterized protein YjcR
MSHIPPARFNYKEAVELWESGWCYGALSEKYGFHEVTIKKYVKKTSPDYEKSRKTQMLNHKHNCPLCVSSQNRNYYKNQKSLF